ncbi:putative odorant receptor 92a isoform X1 [Leptinotarsa decemlineata]|uniref:putative odorant receptor 92a isoform X1 n=1 Tax=Leptinotarsa decemlineata TaxID=7539 RepID=UPI003D308E40
MFEPKKGQAFYICLKTLQLTYCLPTKFGNKWVSYIKFTLIMLIYSSVLLEGLVHLVLTFKIHHEVCGTLGPIWRPNGTPTLPVLIVINIIQLLSAFGTFGSMICIILIIHNSTTLILSHVDHFEVLLHSICEENDTKMKFKKLRQCINYQQRILRMGSHLSYISMLNEGHAVISAAICIGCIGNQIMKEKSIRSFMLLMGYITGSFILCHAGQKMIDKTEYMQEIVYFSKWYTCDLKMMKDINFILARCKNPVYLRFPFGYINYSLFVMIVKTSYSYVTLLNQST